MSNLYVQYPQSGGGGGSSGSQTGVAYVVGPLDGAPTNAQGGTIASFTFYQQSATATFPGLVSSAAQVFSGVKTFLSSPLISTLNPGPTRSVGSSLSSGSVSLVNEVVGVLPAANLPAGTQIGSVNLTNQVSGILPAANLPSGTIIGSVNLTNQVSGNLPISQTSGSVTNSQLQIQYVIGVGPFGSQSANANGGTIIGSSIFFQAATATLPGQVSSNSQTFSGAKTFSQPLILASNGSSAFQQGALLYDNSSQSPTFYNNVASISLQIGQEQWVRVYNNSSVTIVNGRAVYATGAASLALGGDTPTVALAIATTQSTSQFLGASTHDIGNGEFGFITQQGKVHGLDTTGFGSGQRVWLSTASAGFYQSADPQPPFYSVFAGYVLDIGSTTGSMFLSGIRTGTQKPFVNPMTTSGDMITSSGSGNAVRVAIGSPGQYLTVASGSAALPTWTTFTGLTNPMTTSGDIIVGSGSGTTARLAGTIGSLSYLGQIGSGGSSALPTWKPFLPPTLTKFTAVGSASYSVPSGALYLSITMVGDGGGAGGAGTSGPGAGGAGGAVMFGTSLLVCNGGTAQSVGNVASDGGTASLGTGPIGLALSGAGGNGGGQSATALTDLAGGSGGVSPFGGAGKAAQATGSGSNAIANSGSGGGGAGAPSAGVAGAGGSAGGYIKALIFSPTIGTAGGVFAVSVGAGGVGGAAGVAGTSGGGGGSGIIIIEEHYQ